MMNSEALPVWLNFFDIVVYAELEAEPGPVGEHLVAWKEKNAFTVSMCHHFIAASKKECPPGNVEMDRRFRRESIF